MRNLYQELLEYSKSDYYPMHMPGHKRNTQMLSMINPYAIDITEIEGFDNLYEAEDLLKEVTEHAELLYGAEHTHFLINGSTAGLLVGIAAATNKGDKVLVARNCHKAVYNALYLNELEPVFLYPPVEPDFGVLCGILQEKVEQMLIKHPDIKLVIITSPTYEGIVSDVKAIVALAHKKGIPVLVDEAHGAHFRFHPYFPESAIQCGADIVIQSVHKTLPAFTQTALLHHQGNLVLEEEIKRYLSIYQSSSPSYILMAGIDQCMHLLEKESKSLFSEFYTRLKCFYETTKVLKNLKIMQPKVLEVSSKNSRTGVKEGFHNNDRGIFDFDPSKIVIGVGTSGLTGKQLYEILWKKYHIQLEMSSSEYALAMTSICDTEEGFRRLTEALIEIDKDIPNIVQNSFVAKRLYKEDQESERILGILEAYQKGKRTLSIEECEGEISAEYVYLYPPGIPIVIPGERITKTVYDIFISCKEEGLKLKGLRDLENKTIQVIDLKEQERDNACQKYLL